MTADLMFVNGIPFMITFSQNIRLVTTEHVPTRTARQLAKSLMKVVKLYARGGFVVRLVLMDMEFDKIKDLVGLVEVNTTAAREHVAEIEQEVRLVKERTRCITSGLPFAYLHQQIVIHLVYFICLWLNAIPADKGISANFYPREIVTQRQVDFKKDARVLFGAYIEASTGAIVTNDQTPRTHGCIALGPSGNLQGSVKCFDIKTGKVMIRRTFDTLPMPDRVLKLVNIWGKNSKNKAHKNKLEFLDRMGEKFDWDNKDLDDTKEKLSKSLI